ncbi:MAG: exo-alpha-sialidase [Phycisphaerae bacterium]|nr:exo-alpha-sialidase [Phycisphaerae bacterium]
MPALKYADQPYVTVTPSGRWVCVLTTGKGREGAGGQHVAAAVSNDRGKTWSKLIAIESPDGPSASWACPLLTRFGRIYAFYTYNGDKVHLGRDDTHGWYAFKYSDDGGRTWSKQRHRLPMRTTTCDTIRHKGKVVHHFWGICKPITVGDTVYFSFTKLGKYFLGEGEGWLFRSDNILTEKDPTKIRWEMLPKGSGGIKNAKFGSVQEEHNLASLSKPGHLACVYRTTKGFPAISYTRNGGTTWSEPKAMRYSPGGRIIRHPRACPKIWRCGNGKFLFWCHQHGGKTYADRNPVWLCGGVEVEGVIRWSQPEILLYHDNPKKRMSYPDLIEIKDRYWVTETEKEVARVHEIDPSLLSGLWSQFDCKTETKRGLVVDLSGKQLARARRNGAPLPKLGDLSQRGGFTIDMRIRISNLKGPQVIVDSRQGGKGKGITVAKTKDGTLEISFSDGVRSGRWCVDKGLLKTGRRHHVVFIVDGGPGVVSCVVDGQFCDGATHPRQFGWGRFDRRIGSVGGGRIKLPPDTGVEIVRLRVYDRYLRTSEAVANFRALADQNSN